MWYSLKKNKNIISIIKESDRLPIYVSLYIKTPCNDNNYEKLISNQEVRDIYNIELPSKDSIYKIILNNTVDIIELIIPYYDELLESLIEDISLILCGCNCENCNECDEKNESLLSDTLLKTMFYYTLTNSIYAKYSDSAFSCLDCTLNEANICLLLNEKLKGFSDNIILLKKILSIYYLSFYFSEYYMFNNDIKILNNKYKFNRIKKCIKNLGIDINCIISKIEEVLNKNKVWYWQSKDINTKYQFIDINDNFLKDKNYLTLDRLLFGYEFNYNNIGQIGFCIDNVKENSIVVTDILKKSFNNIFNYYYDPFNKRIIILSKEYDSHSKVYLKFDYNEK